MLAERRFRSFVRRAGPVLVLFALLGAVARPPARGQPLQPAGSTVVYLPLVSKGACAPDSLPRINAPGFGTQAIPFERTAIAWFGRLSPDTNYADIRVGYNNTHLYVYLAIFDRHLWYDENPTPQTLTQWDAVTLLLDTSGGNTLSSASWRLVAQLYGEPSAERRAVYRGSAAGWQAASVPFQAVPGWRGNALNDNSDSDRGWAMGFTIPFTGLGLSSAPAEGTTWRMAVILHDRDTRRPADRRPILAAHPLCG